MHLVGMSSILMFRTIAGVTKRFAATRIFTSVRFFSSMGSEMRLQIFQTRIRLETSLELQF